MDDVVVDPEKDLERKQLYASLHTALGHLPWRDREILNSRFFLEKTRKTIASEHHVSSVRIAQIEARALNKLRTWFGLPLVQTLNQNTFVPCEQWMENLPLPLSSRRGCQTFHG